MDIYGGGRRPFTCMGGGANGTARYWNLFWPLGSVMWITRKSNADWAHGRTETNMKPYTELLESLLVMEYNKTPERAKELVKNNPNIVTQGIMHGNQSLRASAMLLDDIDWKQQDASAPNDDYAQRTNLKP